MANIIFYGTRGSYPLSGENYLEFGGATTCVLLRFKSTTIMVDVGTGANTAISDLDDVDEIHIFVSHFHSDHINGFVTLLPAFQNRKVHIYSKKIGDTDIKENIDRVMSQPLWPVSKEIYDNIVYHDLEDVVKVGDVTVTNMNSNHPGGCSLFRFKDDDSDIVTAFDFCHLNGFEDKLVEFAKGCQTLIYDGNMTEEEVLKYPTWGHSSPEAGARIGEKLGVKELYITHHGYRTDDQLSNWESELREKYPFLHFARSGMHMNELLKMIEVGTALTSKKDPILLQRKIVKSAMEITGADGGTLYLLENGKLSFKVMRTKSLNYYRSGDEITLPPVELTAKNVSAASVLEKRIINIANCYEETAYDFSGVRKYDELNNYKTESVLVVPMKNDDDEIIGVLQLINATNEIGQITQFRKKDERIIEAISSQAAVAIENNTYANKISDLLFGFVKVTSLAIDERTPYNANHTKNMVKYAERFFEYENANNGPYALDDIHLREMLMSVWLHDVGKIVTPLSIMNKATRLGDKIEDVKERFNRRDLLNRLANAKEEISEIDFAKLQDDCDEQLKLIEIIDAAGFLTEELEESLNKLEKQNYRELDGRECPVITEEEYYKLSIKKGTLTKEEREVMEYHVVMTQKLLSQLKFPKNFENVPLYAGSHHEFLNGTGYPNHLTADDLPWQARIVTIFDIFEALTAKDRPYKKQMPLEKALSILQSMVSEGKLDGDILAEFIKAEPWDK